MIFKTVNSKLEKSMYDIEIKNIDLALGHWGSEKKIQDFLDIVENYTYDKETLNKNIVLHSLSLLRDNIRIKEMKFYRIPEENKIVLLAVTHVAKMKDFPMFSREMSITFKKEKFAFSIVEILDEEFELIKKGEKTIPENWKYDELLTERFDKLKTYQF
jgi:hypothetical protein